MNKLAIRHRFGQNQKDHKFITIYRLLSQRFCVLTTEEILRTRAEHDISDKKSHQKSSRITIERVLANSLVPRVAKICLNLVVPNCQG